MDRELQDVLNEPLVGHIHLVTDLRDLIERDDHSDAPSSDTDDQWYPEDNEPDDAWDESTNTARTHEITIAYEAMTAVEARWVAQAVSTFVKRRTTAEDVVFTFRQNF
jgi:hypothetical protein